MNESLIQEIRAKADIVEIIQRYLPLIKKGKNYVAVCPFHDDHDPSMSISEDKQIYKCFVCGAGGNVFNFVKDFEKIQYNEAILKVANYVSFPLDEKYLITPKKIDPKLQSLYDVLNEYVKYSRYILNTEDASEAKKYLYKRGLDDSIIQKFEIGYNLNNDQSTKFLLAKGFTLESCVKANISRTNEFGSKDVFNQRIVFPIHNPQGQPVAFTARTMNPNESSKYINSTETPLYVKGNLLYNYHRAIKSIKQAREIIIVEGVMDVIALDRVNIENVVATLGTACTKEQISLIQNASNNVVLCYDSDAAGQTATLKLARLLIAHRLNVSIIQNNTSLDLDEIIEQKSKDALIRLMSQKTSYLDFFFNYSIKRLDLENYNQKKEFTKIILDEINNLKDKFDQEHMLDRLMQVTQFTRDQLDLLRDKPIQPKVIYKPTQVKKVDLNQWAEKEIIGQMLFSAQAVLDFRQELGYFILDEYQKLALTIINYYRNHEELVIADFISTLEDKSMIELVTQIVESDIYYRNYSIEALQDAILQVKINNLDIQIENFKTTYRDDLSLNLNQSRLNEFQELIKVRRELFQMKGDRNHGK
ncbi:MAG TPA: DNA primase [Erysipelotrichaceae bacterium]|nr:DNA primase [Erysipelotrichaceae bacterium]